MNLKPLGSLHNDLFDWDHSAKSRNTVGRLSFRLQKQLRTILAFQQSALGRTAKKRMGASVTLCRAFSDKLFMKDTE